MSDITFALGLGVNAQTAIVRAMDALQQQAPYSRGVSAAYALDDAERYIAEMRGALLESEGAA